MPNDEDEINDIDPDSDWYCEEECSMCIDGWCTKYDEYFLDVIFSVTECKEMKY